jgi:hypothetical protein
MKAGTSSCFVWCHYTYLLRDIAIAWWARIKADVVNEQLCALGTEHVIELLSRLRI